MAYSQSQSVSHSQNETPVDTEKLFFTILSASNKLQHAFKFRYMTQFPCPSCNVFVNDDAYGFLCCGHKCCKSCHFRFNPSCQKCLNQPVLPFQLSLDTYMNVDILIRRKILFPELRSWFLNMLMIKKGQLQYYINCSHCYTQKCEPNRLFFLPCYHICCEVCFWTNRLYKSS